MGGLAGATDEERGVWRAGDADRAYQHTDVGHAAPELFSEGKAMGVEASERGMRGDNKLGVDRSARVTQALAGDPHPR